MSFIIERKSGSLKLNWQNFVDIHRTYVSSIELGKVSVSFDILFKLAEALDVPTSKLFEFRE